jgi:hypothetical protein
MPIGRSSGNITAQDINLEFGQSANSSIGISQAKTTFGINNSGIPYPSVISTNTKMSGISNNDGYHGYTHSTILLDGTNDYIASTTQLPSELRFTYTTPFTFALWLKNGGGTNPISNGYQPRILYLGTTTFGVRTLELFYEGKLSGGTYSNTIIARFVRSAFGTGRRDYRWNLTTLGIITNGNGWNEANNPGWHHLVLTYDGAGITTGAFELYWNGTLLSPTSTNNLNDSSNTWSYDNTERMYVGASGYNLSAVNRWYISGLCFYNYKISASDVTNLYNSGAGRGCNAVSSQCHWWGFAGNVTDRSASYVSGGSTWSNYNLSTFNGPTYALDVRPSK